MKRFLVFLLATTILVNAQAQTSSQKTYDRALELVHAYSGSGTELQLAMELAEQLSKSAPTSGYSQVLMAEALSTWRLNQDGMPIDVRNQVIALSGKALSLNPKLAHAHVSMARALVRSSMYNKANTSINTALAMDPNLSGALFLRAEIFRRQGAIADADLGYQKFINSTASKSRKANGYGWIATMYQEASWNDDVNRVRYVAKARSAYESMLKNDPDGAWRNVNFAIFLNEYANDHSAAEIYATKALRMMEFPMARYHLAAAQYLRLAETSSSISATEARIRSRDIAKSTRISLGEAIEFDSFSAHLVNKLLMLQQRIDTR
jgi:tetratricopeptide (TPR) repeat protein